jgi:amino acid adenylation domain-containing protein
LSFADGVMTVTQGRGVDIVLNSLPGPFIEKGLSVLAPGGRFLEIGKRDIYDDKPIGLRSLRRNAAFFAIDLAQLAAERPDLLRVEIEKVFADLSVGRLDPLPIVEFPLNRAADAFRHVASAQHIGKVVLSFGNCSAMIGVAADSPTVTSDGVYVVTGGLRGFGLETARWLISEGARHLVLAGRTGANDADTQAAVAELRAAGAEIIPVAADVSEDEGARRVLTEATKLGRPVRGIIHAAAVINASLLANLDADQVRCAFAPKVLGAWRLHALTRKMPLDFFVCYSSLATHLGSVGQAHYAGANRAVEVLAAIRRAQGLPCLTVAWGAIGDAGYLTRRTDVARYLRQSGVSQVPAHRALATMGRLLRHDCHSILAGNVRWSAVGRAIPVLAANPRTRQLCSSAGDTGHSDRYFRSQLRDCTEQARTPMLLSFLRDQVATVLKVGAENVEMNRPLAELGLDSLTSFELKNKVEAELGMALTIGAFLQKPTLQSLAAAILERFDTASTLSSDAAGPSGHASVPTMSLGQQALWFVDRLAPGSPAYVLAMCIAIRPRLDPELLNTAYQQVVARHDCLRLRFPADARGPVPEWLDWTAFKITFSDVTHWDERRLRSELDREANSPFELAVGPLVRLRHYRRADRDLFLLQVHHIVADALSIALVAEQILEAYLALRANAPIRWSRQARPYGTYVNWQKSIASGAAAEAHLRFWREQLGDAPTALDLPTDHPRPASQRGPGATAKISIPTELTQRLTQLARARGVTLFTLMLAAFNVLLHRLSGQTDLVVGILTSGRVQPDLQDCVGYLVNPVPVRSRIDPAESFESLLASVDETVRAVLEHQEFPFPRIVQDLGLARDSSRSPAFQVLFAMERSATIDAQGFAVTLLNTEGASVDIGEFKIEAVATKRDRAQFDLTFIVEEFNGDIFGIVDYRTDLWEQPTIELFVAQFNAILQQLARTTAIPVSDIKLGVGEGRPLFGPPLKDVPDIIDSISRAAQAHADRIALTACDGEWTYRELMETVTLIAAALNHHGIEAGALVGICLPRVGALPMALLAVLCSGAAYLPLDRNNPRARLARILADAEPDCIITDRDGAVLLGPYVRCQLLLIDELLAPLPTAPALPPRSFHAGELAYVIHTSGSTGGPLGVEVPRAGLSNFLAAIAGELPLAGTDALIAVTTISFDIAALELFLPLTVGGRVVLADDATCSDGNRLMARLRQGDVTFMQGTPATWQMLLDAAWRGDAKLTALCGGERLHRALANELLERVGSLWNLYGPTETTIWSTCGQVFPDALPPSIGRPIANTTCYVVGEDFKLVPPGVVGELLIAGSGVARGYRNNPSRTADRFIANPFDRRGETSCFRTGDFVRVDREGALVYVGRRDQQVKLRGFRIELAEVESVLLSHGAVREAAAAVHGNDLASVHIAAYVTANPGCDVEHGSLTEYVRTCLPPYMVPASLTVLDEFPRLANGKLDRGRLAARPPRDRDRAAMPRSETERQLLAILRDVLGSDEISVDDDFFAVGGTSLLGMRYLARAAEVFDVNLGPEDLLVAPMVTSMAQRISTLQRARGGAGEQTLVPEQMPHRELWRPLALVRAEGGMLPVRAAAIAYLPEEISGSEVYRSFVKTAERDAFDPYWIGTCSLDWGAIALIMLPLGGRDLFVDSRRTKAMVEQGVACAARLGARCVALTGLIPAATDLGLGLRPVEGISVTTGHAATAVAMSLTVRSALAAASRDLRRERVCFVGLGGIGTVTLRMMLACMEHPQSLVLCDVPAKQAVLEACAQEARQAYGFRGKVTNCLARQHLPDEAYGATLLVAATNAQRVIDIARLRSGTIIVDDSFPLCFDVAAARRRFEAAADILFVSGGSFIPGALKWDIALPPAVPANVRGALMQTMLPPASMITGCILSSLLSEIHGLRATLGPATTADLIDAWNCFSRLGIGAAPLHCGTWAPNPQDLARFRSQLREASARSFVQ